MGLKDFLKKLGERRSREKELDEELRMQSRVRERLLTPEERELTARLEKIRQGKIKNNLERLKSREKNEQWDNMNNLFDHRNTLFKDNEHEILKTENLFSLDRIKAMKQDGLFSK